MRIEVVEFYREDDGKKKNVLEVEFGIHLRGILVAKRNKSYFFGKPWRWGHDQKTRKKVRYPLLSFADPAKEKALMDSIYKEGQKYIAALEWHSNF
jgi:hypothetical protein